MTSISSELLAKRQEQVEEVYSLLKELTQAEEFPMLQANAKKALACAWQMANNLNVKFEQIYDHGV
jgi:hypothetical protein